MADLMSNTPSIMSSEFWRKDNLMAWLAVIAGLFVIYLAYKKFTDEPAYTVDSANTNSGGGGGGGGASSYSEESFPLKKGMKGSNITRLQTALGISPDGKFWNDTQKALKSKYSISEVSESKFNEIVGGKKTTTSSSSSTPLVTKPKDMTFAQSMTPWFLETTVFGKRIS